MIVRLPIAVFRVDPRGRLGGSRSRRGIMADRMLTREYSRVNGDGCVDLKQRSVQGGRGGSMPITVVCVCGKTMRAPDSYAGKSGRCSGCGKSVAVPGVAGEDIIPPASPRGVSAPVAVVALAVVNLSLVVVVAWLFAQLSARGGAAVSDSGELAVRQLTIRDAKGELRAEFGMVNNHGREAPGLIMYENGRPRIAAMISGDGFASVELADMRGTKRVVMSCRSTGEVQPDPFGTASVFVTDEEGVPTGGLAFPDGK